MIGLSDGLIGRVENEPLAGLRTLEHVLIIADSCLEHVCARLLSTIPRRGAGDVYLVPFLALGGEKRLLSTTLY